MSRIDDDHQADRAAERVALEKRLRDQRVKEQSASESAFSRVVEQQSAQKARGERVAAQTAQQAKQLHDEVRADPGAVIAEALQEARRDEAEGQVQRSGQRTAEEGQHRRAAADRGALSGRAEDQGAASSRASAHSADAKGAEGTAHSRREDQGVTQKRLEEKADGSAGKGAPAAPGKEKGELTSARDGGQGGKGSQKDGKEEGAAAGFRLNPALMAPVPLAQPKDSSGSARLRALATEIAQKIVERVRVGKNAAGQAEFQIDLRSNVLSGLSIKISGSNGKIRALFAGSDRQVLKMLRDQAEGLKAALQGRGLTLEELKIEERA